MGIHATRRMFADSLRNQAISQTLRRLLARESYFPQTMSSPHNSRFPPNPLTRQEI
jgi:hypothetical protein